MRDVLSKDKRSLMVVKGKELVGQTARRLEAQGVSVNIYQGANTIDTGAMITVASIATLYARKTVPDCDLLVIDEAHLSRGESYEWLFDRAASQKILGVTATPYHKKGMRHVADIIVYPVGITELQKQGHLVAGRYFAVEKPDLTGIKKVGDDYDQKQLSDRMKTALVGGDPVKEWKERAQGRSTIVFAVSVSHSLAICELYNSKGIPTKHVDAKTTDEERAKIFAQLRSGEIKAISNVGVLTTGVDFPEVSCLQIMRPTMSKALWHQMLGRGTRTNEGKKDFLVLDHSNNTHKHGMIEDEEPGNLDPLPKRKLKGGSPGPATHECPDCLAVFHEWPCPSCGGERKTPERTIKYDHEAELEELTRQSREAYIIKQIVGTARLKGYKKGWCRYKLREKLGEKRGDEIYLNVVWRMDWVPLREETPKEVAQKLTTDF